MIKNDKYYLSASGLGLYAESPKSFFKKYFSEKRDYKDKDYVEGKLVHTLVLEPERFDELYVIFDMKLSVNLTLIAEEIIDKKIAFEVADGKVIQNETLFNFIIKLCKDLEYYQSIVSPQFRYQKIMNEGVNEYLINANSFKGRIIITQNIYNKCKQLSDIIRESEEINHLMTKNNDSQEIINELHLEYEYNEKFGLHGYIDNIKVDHETRIIYLNELKTTNKHISKFIYEIKNLKYDLKIAHYTKLLTQLFEDLLSNGYELQIRLIVIDHYGHLIDFLISEDTLLKYIQDYKRYLDDLTESFNNNNWKNPTYYKSTIFI